MTSSFCSRLFGAGLVATLCASDSRADSAGCSVTAIDYTLSASLTLSGTPMGGGNGTYAIGPGSVTLQFERSEVKMTAYAMREAFTVHAHTALWTTTVATEATSTGASDGCSLAEGTFDGHTIHWRTPVRGYRTDGTLTCSGSFCGSFGVPSRGRSPLHVGPAPQQFKDFVFSPDLKTFTMATTTAVKTEMPKQTSTVSMAGRETRRGCVPQACAQP
jgi:hypothetical protein